MAARPEFAEPIFVKPRIEFFGVEPVELGGAVRFFADDDGLGRVREGVDQDVGVGGDEELGAGGGFDEEFGDFRDDVGVEA